MKRIAFVSLCIIMFASVSAQTKPKAPAQPAKPSKQTTIKYIIEKLNENCVGVSQQEGETLTKYDKDLEQNVTDVHYYTAFHYKSYNVEEKNGTAYIIVKVTYEVKKTDYQGSDSYDRFSNISIEIPVNKITDIMFATIEKKITNEYRDQKVKEGYRAMLFLTKSTNIIYYEIEKDKTSNLPAINIPSFDTENEPKLKKAILNLQSYYKTNDPFEN